MAFPNSSVIGANLNASVTTADFALNTVLNGSSDSLWVFVNANGAISAGDCVQINATGTATRATAAGVATETNTVAFAQYAFADGEYGWVAKRGRGMTISVSATAADNTQLYIATTSGKLSTTASSGTLIGVQIANVSSTATTTTTTGELTWPKCITPGF